jgi:16S rRNA (uracil1498-N3)-methyltransferase
MKIHRFFVEQQIQGREGSTVTYTDPTSQLRKVFRLSIGDRISLFDGSGNEYLGEISKWTDDGAEIDILSVEINTNKPKRKVFLISAIVKKDNFEWICEKATELGVEGILPVISERTEKKSINMDRLHMIVKEASEQSGRSDVPEIFNPVEFEGLIEKIPENTKILVCDPSGQVTLPECVSNQEPLSICIGPEGGWSPKELEYFKSNNIQICSLGNLTLRAETAVVSALSIALI